VGVGVGVGVGVCVCVQLRPNVQMIYIYGNVCI